MSKKKLQRSYHIENRYPSDLIKKLVHKLCESVADAFLGQIEYGKDYVINTELVKEDWREGFSTKYTYNLEFDELVRCRDCKFGEKDGLECMRPDGNGDYMRMPVEPDGFCKWGERREDG